MEDVGPERKRDANGLDSVVAGVQVQENSNYLDILGSPDVSDVDAGTEILRFGRYPQPGQKSALFGGFSLIAGRPDEAAGNRLAGI